MSTRIAKRRESISEIPTASTADIAFLLIIFFMLTTHFRKDQGIKNLPLPKALMTERIMKRRNVANVWIDRQGRTYVDDNQVSIPGVTAVAMDKLAANPETVVLLFADKDASYGYVTDVLEGLKLAQALKVTFATQYRDEEPGGGQ
ncbi:biopolymer transporter ExbD [candidate division WOR-3 bacterium]|nr:biopolymer transporter ExbD [candidate division WOR-3 bacterium]